jgi:myo-inositol-1(or 4)-monophosphatase
MRRNVVIQHSALINVIFKAAEKAARGLVRDFGEVENLQITRKGVADFVSNADTDAEEIIIAELTRARPGWGLIMEESGVSPPEDEDGPSWIVDPLDGTTNYIHGIPHFAISIAATDRPLEKGGRVIAGGIFDPLRNEFFHAEHGQGAFLNDRRIRVSGRRKMAECLIATGVPYLGRGEAEDHELFRAELGAVMGATSGIRRMGAAALDLAWVAAGRYDGFWERGLSVWDIAAGVVIVREAGGLVSDFAARNQSLISGDVVAANGYCHGNLLKKLQEGRKGG